MALEIKGVLFLKKKNQKDFLRVFSEWQIPSSGQCRRHCPTGKSFLVLFFKKEQFCSADQNAASASAIIACLPDLMER
jgi:hypothetical protein